MGLNPENLEIANVNITGVNGQPFRSQTREMYTRIINKKTGTESWEKVYVNLEVQDSLLSKDCLVRLKIIDASQFLDDDAMNHNGVNIVETKDKLSDCEKSFKLTKMVP